MNGFVYFLMVFSKHYLQVLINSNNIEKDYSYYSLVFLPYVTKMDNANEKIKCEIKSCNK